MERDMQEAKDMSKRPVRLVVVSNRLPVSIKKISSGWEVRPGSGGLVTALAPVLRDKGGIWIGWSGGIGDHEIIEYIKTASLDSGFDLQPVPLTPDEIRDYYYGFSNEIIWPLFHDLQTRCNFKPEYWYQYLKVNRKFAERIAALSNEGDFIWVHDYHLMLIAQQLKGANVTRKTGFFLHIPFPPMDIFIKLPWRGQILSALLEYDIVGFQTLRDKRNFINCLHILRPDIKISGKGHIAVTTVDEREVRIGAFPISIDFESFAKDAASHEVEERVQYLKEAMPDCQVLLGVDRLDYTKGIPERLEAMRNALKRHPDLHEKITLVQVVVPSRQNIPEYALLKARIERLVGEINGEFTMAGWVPIHYLYRHLDRHELLAHYRLSDIALVTPLKDGMNLVAKEYCACNYTNRGVLILSEFAGAASQLHQWAIMINPYDIEGVSAAIHKAFYMDEKEKIIKMRKLRSFIKKRDIFWWVKGYLEAALSEHPSINFVAEEYLPNRGISTQHISSGAGNIKMKELITPLYEL